MFELFTVPVRRWTAAAQQAARRSRLPLVRIGQEGSADAVAVAHTDIGMLRGVTSAAADTSACTCPDACERDHANE